MNHYARPLLASVLFTVAAGFLSAADAPQPAAKPAALPSIASAKEGYPLDTCAVTGGALDGSMGPTIEYIHKQSGKPDRLVRLCCKACVATFKKDPAKFLAKIDAAAAAKAK